MITDNHGGAGDPVVFVQGGNFLLPDFLARGGVETNEPVILLAEVKAVIPHSETTVAKTVAGPDLPVVMPKKLSAMSVDGVDVARLRGIDDAVYDQNSALESRGAAVVGTGDAVAEAADDQRRRGAAPATASCEATASAAGRRLRFGSVWTAGRCDAGVEPLHAQALDVLGRNLVQEAVAPAAVVAGIACPVVVERLEKIRRIQRAALPEQQRRRIQRDTEAGEKQQFFHG